MSRVAFVNECGRATIKRIAVLYCWWLTARVQGLRSQEFCLGERQKSGFSHQRGTEPGWGRGKAPRNPKIMLKIWVNATIPHYSEKKFSAWQFRMGTCPPCPPLPCAPARVGGCYSAECLLFSCVDKKWPVRTECGHQQSSVADWCWLPIIASCRVVESISDAALLSQHGRQFYDTQETNDVILPSSHCYSLWWCVRHPVGLQSCTFRQFYAKIYSVGIRGLNLRQ